jgi:hypothetical protein
MDSPAAQAQTASPRADLMEAMMVARRSLLVACIALVVTLPAGAQAPATTDVAGVKYDNAISVGGQRLLLNGAGIRTRFGFKVYAAGLYLAQKADTPQGVLAGPGARRLHVVMLRDIDADALGKLFTDGMQQNTEPQEFARVQPAAVRLGGLFAAKKRMASGESFTVDFLPGSDTTVLINGKPAGEPITGAEFFGALMKIWLGPKPADGSLKEALLGGPRAPPPPPGLTY